MKNEITKKLKEHDKQFAKIDKRLNGHDKQLEVISKIVLNNSNRLNVIEKNMATKKDIKKIDNKIDKITNTLDILVGFSKKKDEELTFMGERVTKVEKDVKHIKPLVGLSS